MSAFITIVIIWLVGGLLCWAVIVRFFPPTPLIGPDLPESTEPGGKPFSVRDVPMMVVCLIPLSVIAPFLLAGILLPRARRHGSGGTK